MNTTYFCARLLPLIVLAAAVAAPVHASIVQFSSRAAFTTAAGGGTVTQNFNAFPATPNAFEGHTFNFGDFTAIQGVTGNGGGDIEAVGVVNGTPDIIGSIFIGGAEFTFTFAFPITALGFDASNLADQRYDLLIFNNTAGDSITIHDLVDQTRFWGFVSDTPFTSFTIRQTAFSSGGGANDGFRIDDVTYTPAPGAAALLGLGGALGMRRRPR